MLKLFEEGLVGHVVMSQLQSALDEAKRRAQDPAPLKREAEKLKKEITRLVDQLASGELEDVRDAITARKVKLEHLQGTIDGLGTVEHFDVQEFYKKVIPVIKDWKEHLRKNHATAAQVLRKIIPNRLTVKPRPEGGWDIEGGVEYRALLAECGFDRFWSVIESVAKPKGSRARHGARSRP